MPYPTPSVWSVEEAFKNNAVSNLRMTDHGTNILHATLTKHGLVTETSSSGPGWLAVFPSGTRAVQLEFQHHHLRPAICKSPLGSGNARCTTQLAKRARARRGMRGKRGRRGTFWIRPPSPDRRGPFGQRLHILSLLVNRSRPARNVFSRSFQKLSLIPAHGPKTPRPLASGRKIVRARFQDNRWDIRSETTALFPAAFLRLAPGTTFSGQRLQRNLIRPIWQAAIQTLSRLVHECKICFGAMPSRPQPRVTVPAPWAPFFVSFGPAASPLAVRLHAQPP